MDSFTNLRDKFCFESVRKNADKISDTLSSVVRSRSSRIGAFSSDIAQRFQNDIYAWGSSPSIHAIRTGLTPKGTTARISQGSAEVKSFNDCAPMVVYAESLNSKQKLCNERRLHETVDKFIKVILPETNEAHDQRNTKSFRHMRHYSFYRRTDRDLIRRRLASETGEPCDQATPTSDDVTEESRSSLQAKLRTGPNLQICFMNEVASDGEECEEVDSDVVGGSSPDSANLSPAPAGVDNADDAVNTVVRSDSADSSSLTEDTNNKTEPVDQLASSSFAEYQLRLREQTRQALASCERAAREQLQLMTAQQLSPTTRVVQTALHKIGVDCPRTRRRVNRSLLSDMNVAQLQIIANDLHTCIEELNGVLMTSLMERDEAVMERDSQLVHIEDLISYYGQKQDHCPRPSSSSSDPAHPPAQTVSGGRKFLQRFSSKTR